jgi:DNA-binding transcriptional ArsR family regulator
MTKGDAPAASPDAESAATAATALQALAAPGRLLILTRLRQGPCLVTGLAVAAGAAGMEQPTVSHQLRLPTASARSLAGGRIVCSPYENSGTSGMTGGKDPLREPAQMPGCGWCPLRAGSSPGATSASACSWPAGPPASLRATASPASASVVRR